MNIIHITNCLNGGGIQNFILSLLPEQVKLGHHVTLIVIEKHRYEYCFELEKKLKDRGVDVICLNKLVSNKISMIKTLIKCRIIIQQKHPDVVNSHGEMSHIYAALGTAFSSIPHCITVHNAPEIWGLANIILNGNKPVIFCSEAAYELRQQKNRNSIAINNGVAPDIIRTSEKVDLRKELGLTKDDKLVISVGSLRPQKNYEMLKQIVPQLNNQHIHFCICGGSYGEGYISTDSFKGYSTIHFLGLRSDVSAIENGSNLFLSCATFEGLPIAVLEAFFNGIPCVLSPIVQHEKIAKGINACFIPEEFTPKAFAKAINEALNVCLSHEEIYAKRKEKIEQYSIADTAKKYIEYYKSIEKNAK